MRRTYLLFFVCILLALGIMLWGMGGESEDAAPPPKAYALLLADDRGTAVLQFRQGVQTAVEACGATLTLYPADHGQPLAEQIDPVLQAVEAQAVDGLIVQPGGEDLLPRASALAARMDIPLVYWCEADEVHASIVPDYAQQGRLLGEGYLALREGAAPVPAVFLRDAPGQRAMLEGLQTVLPAGDMTVILRPDTGTLFADLAPLPEGADLLILDMEMAARVAMATQARHHIYCVDPGDDRVTLLEDGYVRAMVLDMPYAQGYLAVQALQEAGGGRTVASPARWVTRETMYDAENVKLMFPLLQ